MYLQKEIADFNPDYLDRYKGITVQDVQTINARVRMFEGSVDNCYPQPGDVVTVREIFNDEETISAEARIECIRNGKALICLNVITAPHVKENGILSISGGRWVAAALGELEYVGREQAKFWLWGALGRWSSGGGLDFQANVRRFQCTVDQRVKIF